jgi:hypothetical protein
MIMKIGEFAEKLVADQTMALDDGYVAQTYELARSWLRMRQILIDVEGSRKEKDWAQVAYHHTDRLLQRIREERLL